MAFAFAGRRIAAQLGILAVLVLGFIRSLGVIIRVFRVIRVCMAGGWSVIRVIGVISVIRLL